LLVRLAAFRNDARSAALAAEPYRHHRDTKGQHRRDADGLKPDHAASATDCSPALSAFHENQSDGQYGKCPAKKPNTSDARMQTSGYQQWERGLNSLDDPGSGRMM